MNKKKIISLVVAGCMAMAAVGCSAPGTEEEAVVEETQVKKIPVETMTAGKSTFSNTVVLSGLINPDSTVAVMPKVAGMEKIVAINAKVGDKVSKGDVLATLDTSTLDIQMDLAQMAYDDAVKNYEKNKVLYEAGALPQANFEQLEMAMKQASQNLKSQQMQYDNMIVTAPISGTIVEANGEVGSFASAQGAMFVISNVGTLEVQTGINEMHISKIKEGQEVNVMIAATKDQYFKGKIRTIGPVMNMETKAYPVTISLSNKGNQIKAGMYAEVEVVTESKKGTIVVPADAVILREATQEVFVMEEGKAVKKSVKTGLNNGKEIEIIEGLAEGEQLIIKGNKNIVDGDVVAVVEPIVAEEDSEQAAEAGE